MKTNKNPYRTGSAYAKIFDALREAAQKGISRLALLKAGNSASDITVVLSSRVEGTVRSGADCRGNFSAQGHIYCVKLRTDKEGTKLFVLNWRKNEMEPRMRPAKTPIVAAEKVKAKAKSRAKTKAKK